MKFKVEIEVEIFDEELLEIINNNREWDNKDLYNSIDEIPENEIMEWIEDDKSYFQDEIDNYGFDIEKVTIIKE